VTDTDIANNDARMTLPWNPPTPIEHLFSQLEDGVRFIRDAEEPVNNKMVLRMGYNNIFATGLFGDACRDWRLKDDATKTMATFQEHFKIAARDRAMLATTANAGYQANLANETTPQQNPAAARAQATADANQAQITVLLAALAARNDVVNIATTGTLSYCWTHGTTRNLAHTSASCNNKQPGHQDDATATNRMGGSNTMCGRA
jgi:hypothetical protein